MTTRRTSRASKPESVTGERSYTDESDDRRGVDLVVDPDLAAMIDDVLAKYSGPDVKPDATGVWNLLREVGLARLTAPESSDGSGAGWTEAAALLRACAAAGVAVPYAETDLLAGPLRRAVGIDDTSDATCTVAVLGVDGVARSVPWAGATETVIVVRPSSDSGYELAEIRTSALQVKPVEGVSAETRADVAAGGRHEWRPVDSAAVEAFVLRGALSRSLQCVGAMGGMLDLSISHTTGRHQFGRPLSRFQSVQNLVVDIAAESLLASAAVDAALADAAETDLSGAHSEFRIAVSRSAVARAVTVAVRAAHQVHGAIGTTHEHTLQRRSLPALQWAGEFGSAALWEGALSRAVVGGGVDGVWPLIVGGAEINGVARNWIDAIVAR